jgi:hypothetical protein
MTDLLRIQVPDEAGWRVDYKYLNAIEDHMVDNGEPASLEQIEAVILAIAAINDAELEAQRAQPQVEPSELAMMLRTIAGQVQGGLKFSTQAGKDEYARVINEAADALAVAQPQVEPTCTCSIDTMEPARDCPWHGEPAWEAQPQVEPVAWQNKLKPAEMYEYEQLDPMWYGEFRPLYAAPVSAPLPADVRTTLERAERKLSAYVGVCKGDKELTDTVIPMVRAALAVAAQPQVEPDAP